MCLVSEKTVLISPEVVDGGAGGGSIATFFIETACAGIGFLSCDMQGFHAAGYADALRVCHQVCSYTSAGIFFRDCQQPYIRCITVYLKRYKPYRLAIDMIRKHIGCHLARDGVVNPRAIHLLKFPIS